MLASREEGGREGRYRARESAPHISMSTEAEAAKGSVRRRRRFGSLRTAAGRLLFEAPRGVGG